MLKPKPQGPQDAVVFRHRAFKLKMKPLGWPLLQSDWRKRLRHIERLWSIHAQRYNDVKRQQGNSHLPPEL